MRGAWWRAAVLVGAFATLETALLPGLGMGGARPGCLLILVLYVGLWGRPAAALGVAWACGLTKDLFSAGPIGVHALMFLGVAAGVAALRHYLFIERPFTQVVVALAASVACEAVHWAFLAAVHLHRRLPGGAGDALVGALYTAVLAPVMLALLRRTRSWWRLERRPGSGSA